MKQKTLSRVIYFLVISLLVLSLSGCERHKFNSSSSDDNNSNNNTQTITSGAFIGIRTPSLLVGESYKIYKGSIRLNGTTAKYYVEPVDLAEGDTVAAVNLSFNDILSNDALVITTSDDDAIAVFAYNPYGTTSFEPDCLRTCIRFRMVYLRHKIRCLKGYKRTQRYYHLKQ